MECQKKPKKRSGSWSRIFFQNEKESLIVYSFISLTVYSLYTASILVQNILQGCNYKHQFLTKLDGIGVSYRYQL